VNGVVGPPRETLLSTMRGGALRPRRGKAPMRPRKCVFGGRGRGCENADQKEVVHGVKLDTRTLLRRRSFTTH
jgi:hypothetical protein